MLSTPSHTVAVLLVAVASLTASATAMGQKAAPAPPAGPSDDDEWEKGDPIPAGYEADTEVRLGLVIGGSLTFAAAWGLAIGLGALMVDDTESEDEPSHSASDAYPMFVPVVGPFIAMGTYESQGALGFALAGTAQNGGLAMLIIGLAAQKDVLRPARHADDQFRVTPIAGRGFQGLGVSGSF